MFFVMVYGEEINVECRNTGIKIFKLNAMFIFMDCTNICRFNISERLNFCIEFQIFHKCISGQLSFAEKKKKENERKIKTGIVKIYQRDYLTLPRWIFFD